AFGAGVTVTTTSLDTVPHEFVNVYVYVPETSTNGLNMLVPLANAGDQVPPISALPIIVNKSVATSLLQISKTPSVPALNGASTVIITSMLPSTRGAEAVTSYVNLSTPGATKVASKLAPVKAPVPSVSCQIPPIS